MDWGSEIVAGVVATAVWAAIFGAIVPAGIILLHIVFGATVGGVYARLVA